MAMATWAGGPHRTGSSINVASALRRMPSSNKHMLGEMNPVKADQVSHSGMENQLFKHPRCKWDPGQSLDKAPPDAGASSWNKKKSRKHQRCMMHMALEQNKLPVPSLGDQAPFMALSPSKKCRRQGQEISQLTEEDVEKDFSTLCPASSVPSAGTARQCSSSQGLGNLLPTPFRSAAGPNSFSYLKPKSKKPVAIDCEMVGTGPSGKTSELARCTVVNYDGDVIYDKYVRPELPVVDYRTRWSGITQEHMRKATPFSAARAEILQILRDKIVVGHAIHNDFRALKYFHPQEWTRDTSHSPLLREKGGLPLKANVSLKGLAEQLLHKQIQVSKKGHSSVEDAQTSMELYRLVEVQWEKDMTGQRSSSPPNRPPDNCTDNNHYMDDQYWPKDLNQDCK